MRKLKTSDVFAFLRITSEAHIKDEVRRIAEAIQKDGTNVNAQEVGYDLILAVMDGMSGKRAEAMVYEFLGGVWEMKPEDVANLDLVAFRDTLKTWATEYVDRAEVKAFFGHLSRLMR